MKRTGKCMCGAVSYQADGLQPGVTACHCEMCRRWTGGPLLALGSDSVRWSGEEKITVFTSSGWAERGFCSVCGSGLFYRVTAPGPHQGRYHIPLGTLDDQAGLEVGVEFFIDSKPEAYALAGERKRLTGAEVMALFSGDG